MSLINCLKNRNIELRTLTDKEFELFKKYKKGDFVNQEDRFFVDKYTSIGIMNQGLGEKENKLKGIAILTSLGKRTLSREKNYRNPIKYLFYHIWAVIE